MNLGRIFFIPILLFNLYYDFCLLKSMYTFNIHNEIKYIPLILQ